MSKTNVISNKANNFKSTSQYFSFGNKGILDESINNLSIGKSDETKAMESRFAAVTSEAKTANEFRKSV